MGFLLVEMVLSISICMIFIRNIFSISVNTNKHCLYLFPNAEFGLLSELWHINGIHCDSAKRR